ncbi:MAG TPA: hypothetical protein DCY07_03545 [Rhodospirillaceae bacterium]|nr:hypothetical protein [Rhodospirillaceae bacterium]
MKRQISYLWALMTANMKSYNAERKRLFVMALFMMIQNAMFFGLWVIFFQTVGDLKGWKLVDVTRMFGLAASAIGLSLFFFNGARTLAYRVMDDSIDSFLTRPRKALPMLLMSSSSPASLGDITFGPLLWLTLGEVPLSLFPWFVLLTLFSALIFTAATLMMFSIVFWLKTSSRFPEQLFEMLIILSSNILHGQPFGVKALMFTIIPAGFISYLPAQLMRGFDPLLFGILLVATVFYAALAAYIFNAGLRRYVRGVV